MRWLFVLMLLAWPARAQEMPSCNQDRVGAVACLSGKLCSCGYARGGIVSGRPEGYRWDCGVLRPSCGEALAPPALAPMFPQPVPQLFMNIPPPTSLGDAPQMTPWMR
jgi:hypothetical protein